MVILKHATLFCTSFFTCTAAAEHTNFVIIFLDDMGYGDLEQTGALGYHTPNLTRMANEGMRFTDFYAAQAVSSASRAGLLTGCYPNKIGISGALMPGSKTGLNPQETTIASMLRQQNYTNAIFGKWHLGDSLPFLPLQHGFDEYQGIPYSNDMWPLHPTMKWFPELPWLDGNTISRYILTGEDQAEMTTIITELSVDFIERNKNNPFFLYVAHPMPHVPLFVSDKFKGKSQQGTYGDVMMELDWSVGQIMESLHRNGIDENTLVIFTSDNGPWLNYGNHAGSAGGLREGKGGTFDGGMKVPCIMRWPAVIPPGTIANQLASTIDILPTIAHISGADIPAKSIDGVNLFPVLAGDKDSKPRSHFLYYYRENNLEAIRDERFKLILPHSGRSYEGFLPGNDGMPGPVNEQRLVESALYDLRRDPGERYDVQQLYPEVVKRLKSLAN
jgi:arylsulfatase A-like enzyme